MPVVVPSLNLRITAPLIGRHARVAADAAAGQRGSGRDVAAARIPQNADSTVRNLPAFRRAPFRLRAVRALSPQAPPQLL